jgi:hypothetical protein
MPIPFGNVLPALALMLIGLALVFRDGVAVVWAGDGGPGDVRHCGRHADGMGLGQ